LSGAATARRGGALPIVLLVDGVLAGGLGASAFDLSLPWVVAIAGVVVVMLVGLAYREHPRADAG
jgi:hypothetical protein